MKRINKILSAFAMLFVVVLTTACSGLGVKTATRTFEKEEKTGVSRWDISKNYFKFGTNMYIYPTNNIKIGYHLLIPIAFKGVDIDGFFIRNGLSLGFVF